MSMKPIKRETLERGVFSVLWVAIKEIIFNIVHIPLKFQSM